MIAEDEVGRIWIDPVLLRDVLVVRADILQYILSSFDDCYSWFFLGEICWQIANGDSNGSSHGSRTGGIVALRSREAEGPTFYSVMWILSWSTDSAGDYSVFLPWLNHRIGALDYVRARDMLAIFDQGERRNRVC